MGRGIECAVQCAPASGGPRVPSDREVWGHTRWETEAPPRAQVLLGQSHGVRTALHSTAVHCVRVLPCTALTA